MPPKHLICPRIQAMAKARAHARAVARATAPSEQADASDARRATTSARRRAGGRTRKPARLRPKRVKPARAKAWHVYLVRCADGSLYCGVSNDLPARVAAHNAGRGAKYTRPRRPVTLVWSRRCGTKSKACQQEYRIKQLTRTEKQALAGL